MQSTFKQLVSVRISDMHSLQSTFPRLARAFALTLVNEPLEIVKSFVYLCSNVVAGSTLTDETNLCIVKPKENMRIWGTLGTDVILIWLFKNSDLQGVNELFFYACEN